MTKPSGFGVKNCARELAGYLIVCGLPRIAFHPQTIAAMEEIIGRNTRTTAEAIAALEDLSAVVASDYEGCHDCQRNDCGANTEYEAGANDMRAAAKKRIDDAIAALRGGEE
jgi:alkylhydroperoxidase family enzyme